MSDHLPECAWGAGHFKKIAEHLFGADYPCPQCDALRRCERRVRFSMAQEGAMESGWKAGVKAAREAVEAVPSAWVSDAYREKVLAAIDELRGEK